MRIAPTITAPTEMQFLNAAQLLMEWDAVDGADTYEVQIATDPGFSSIVDSDDAVATTSFDLSGLDPTDGQHFARVRVSAPRTGEWSVTRSFSLYWLDDEFITDQAAPITSPRTAEPGPGQLFVQDHSSGRWQIADGIIEPAASSSSTVPMLATNSILARETGVAFSHRTAQNPIGPSGIAAFSPAFGWSTSQLSPFAANVSGIAFSPAQVTIIELSSITISGIDALPSGEFRVFTHVMRSSGAFHVVNNKLAYIATIGSAATYPFVAQASTDRHTPQTDYMRVAKLGGPWLDDYGVATARLAGARSAGDLFTHDPGALWLEFTVTTLPASGVITINLRRQDNNNCWQLTLDSTGAFNLNEVVGGTPTSRLAMTSCQANDRLMLVMDGAAARLLRWRPGATGSANSSLYTSVATFTTQVNGELVSLGSGGAISDLITWPRVLTGEALEWIQAL